MRYFSDFHPLPAALVHEIVQLSNLVFPPPATDHNWRLERMPEVSVFYAREGQALVAFKAGYAIAQSKYYSWLGAVHPEYRNVGIASELTRLQHSWLVERGYSTVETSSRADNSAMARVNLRSGFVIRGSEVRAHGLQVLWSRSFK
jgi:ribosomal protein S18 acetylase RimI-like enzyme